jgi:hypothetical protein
MMEETENVNISPEETAEKLKHLVMQLQAMERNDLLLHAIGVPLLEELRIEAARGKLSRLEISSDFCFTLVDYGKIVVLAPIHKALYLLFLNHPEGIEFKNLMSYRMELLKIYRCIANRLDEEKIEQTIDRLVNPFDNAINEKCSRIKEAFSCLMDEYSARYYVISSHTQRHIAGSSHIWYERLKVITLPRELVLNKSAVI